MPESKTALRVRLKSLRRKHHLGEFSRKKRTSSRPSTRKKTKSINRRSFRTVSVAKRRIKSRRRKTMFSGFMKPIIGGIALGVLDPVIQDLASRFGFGLGDDLAKGALAIGAKQFTRSSIITAVADAQLVLSARALSQNFSGGLLGGSKPSDTSSTQSGGATFV